MITTTLEDVNGCTVEIDFNIVNVCDGCSVTPPYRGDVDIVDIRVLDSVDDFPVLSALDAVDEVKGGTYDDDLIDRFG
jgi:hypothetical protein